MKKTRGNIHFSADGNDYALRYNIDKLCDLEAVTGKSIIEIFQMLSNPSKWSLTFARDALFVGVEPEISRREAGEIVVAIGGLTKAIEYVGEALEAAFPTPKDEEEEKTEKSSPQKAGTGSSS